MLRTLLIAVALLGTSGAAMARGSYDYDHDRGRVVSVEPHFSISFGSRHHDGFRVLYESGGNHYWTHTTYRPSHVIVLPPRHQVHHVYHYSDYGYGRDKRYKHKWKKHHDDRDDDRRSNDRGHRDHHRHGRD